MKNKGQFLVVHGGGYIGNRELSKSKTIEPLLPIEIHEQLLNEQSKTTVKTSKTKDFEIQPMLPNTNY